MFELHTFIRQGHQKIIDHYRWLRDTASSDAERDRFQRRIEQETELFERYENLERAA